MSYPTALFPGRRTRARLITAGAVSAAHAALGLWALASSSLPLDAPRADGDVGRDHAVQVSLVRIALAPASAPSAGGAPSAKARTVSQDAASDAAGQSSPSPGQSHDAANQEIAATPAAPLAGASMAASTSADNSLILSYRDQLRRYISKFQRYPDDARRQGAQGQVEVAFALDRDGSVYHLTIGRSSGVAALDQEAMDSVRRAAPLPQIPPALPDRFIIQIPVVFDLS
jgi:protein TonB